MSGGATGGRSTGGSPGAQVRNLGLVLRPRTDLASILGRIARWAATAGVALHGLAGEDRHRPETSLHDENELAEHCDMLLALGGDGTMLGALALGAPSGVPVLGVNLGTLGFLTEVDPSHLEDGLLAIQHGSFTVEGRTAIELTGLPERARAVAYNDVVLSRVPGRGLAKLGLRIDGELLVRYSSDGVIVATPQGSTGYSFAAGGPLVSPRSRGLVLTPDAPHGLFNRGVVLAEHELLEIEVLPTSAPVAIEIDGRLASTIEAGGVPLGVGALPEVALVVRVRAAGFADQARRKLGIIDPAGLADFDPAGHERR